MIEAIYLGRRDTVFFVGPTSSRIAIALTQKAREKLTSGAVGDLAVHHIDPTVDYIWTWPNAGRCYGIPLTQAAKEAFTEKSYPCQGLWYQLPDFPPPHLTPLKNRRVNHAPPETFNMGNAELEVVHYQTLNPTPKEVSVSVASESYAQAPRPGVATTMKVAAPNPDWKKLYEELLKSHQDLSFKYEELLKQVPVKAEPKRARNWLAVLDGPYIPPV